MNKSLLLVAVMFTCCKGAPKAPDVDPDFAPSAAKVKARLATLAKIKTSLEAIPPLKHDTLELPGGQRASSTVITADQLTVLGNCFPDAKICNDLWWRLSECEQLSKLTPEEAAAKFDAVNAVKRCAGIQYVAVARKRSFTKPVADKASSTYEAGHISVELMVFDLVSGASMGGFVVDAKTPESLDGISPTTNVTAYLEEYLGRKIFDAMRAKIDT